jgi:D-glycero-alpha-D-manno-heptose 1-phosphate guanylyltransferase
MITAIVLAGGLGTRLRSVVPDLPKPMAPIKGRPFLEYQLDYWIAQGVDRFVLSLGYRHEVIVEHFGNSYQGVKLDYVVEPTPLGTEAALCWPQRKLPTIRHFYC